MAGWVTVVCALPSCGEVFRRPVRAGRPRLYHRVACQKQAQRLRDAAKGAARRPARAAGGWGQLVAEDVHAGAGRLLEAQARRAPLTVRLACARALRGDADHYVAAVVRDARADGMEWGEIGSALGVQPDSARRRWTLRRVEQQLSRRSNRQAPPAPGTASGAAPAAPAPASAGEPEPDSGPRAGLLAAALTALQERSRVSPQAAAELAGCSPSYVSRILAGDRVPTWPVLQTLARAFGGVPEELRLLWEVAQGAERPGRVSVAGAADQMLRAIRGLHLAAGQPDAEAVCALARGVSAELVRSVLAGETVPDWPVVSQLAAALGGHPGDLRPYWERMHYAALAAVYSDEFGPSGCFARSAAPEGGEDRDGG
ncbi:helix-turn-helix domain-containing protein [Kitasatospora sp. NPDC059811]|uniref:helix-turn-helix domain-containing protein n=1 Tax=Streptomycetaceae TaxID=2062 RepID=UPI000AACA8DB|nr:helix-turn-helix transcriptional regulator [Streptomyces sp. MJM8645]